VFLPDIVIRSRRVVTAAGTRAAAIHIRNGRIIGVVDFDNVPAGCPLDDAADAAILPGIVDTHVHVGGLFESTTRAAAAGGVTTIVDGSLGALAATSVARLEAQRRAAQSAAVVDVGFWGSAVAGNAGDLAPLFEAGVLGFACTLAATAGGDQAPVSEADLHVMMPAMRRIGATLCVHAEVSGPIEPAVARHHAARRWFERIRGVSRESRRYAAYLARHPKSAETDAVGLLIQLCAAHQTRTHIVQLSSSETLAPLYHARAARLPITAGTSPHHLFFVAEEIPDGATMFASRPPIRERENREFLWAALANGLIQIVASDHSVASPERQRVRSGDFRQAASGIASLQLSLPAIWTAARGRGYTLDQVVNWMCRAPAQLAGLSRKGKIDVGHDADLIVFNADAEYTVERASLQPAHRVTPYLGWRLRGAVERTYLRGSEVFRRGDTQRRPPRGQALVRQ